ncbi:PepSY-associated TM helix domain-containing protein [Xanthobacter sp. KR7-225]|uniref:PepSY-associated TM helix domain-containing protein n=1 Tax=Xanthobacter sp. KR7-225 TaxID=3156613 RepID=UPI0032B566F6
MTQTAPATGAHPRHGGLALRSGLVWAHRILGLATALFLFVAGITGSLLAFHDEIDVRLNPQAYTATARGAPLAPEALAAKIEAGDPDRAVWYMALEHAPGHAAAVFAMGRIDPASGQPVDIAKDYFNVDPVSGEILAARLWGACCFSRLAFVPFIYEFHHNLSLPGTMGILLMGVVAVLWFVDGFVGLALTLPRGRPFLAKWTPAFAIKGGSRFRLHLDLHRAVALWLFVILIAIAFSSIAMNLRREVAEPIVRLFSTLTPTPLSGAPFERLRPRTLSFDGVLAAGVREARARGWSEPASEIFYSPHYGVFGVSFGDHDDPFDQRWLYFSGDTGELRGAAIPGAGSAGDVFLALQLPIHSGRVLGLFGRILIAVMGVVVAMLSVTGVVIWWIKRKGRRARAMKAARPKAVPAE